MNGKRVFSSPASRPTLGTTHAPIQLVPGTTTLSLNQSRHEANQLPPCSNKIKNGAFVTSTIESLHDAVLN
jgi:hypothetical protein